MRIWKSLNNYLATLERPFRFAHTPVLNQLQPCLPAYFSLCCCLSLGSFFPPPPIQAPSIRRANITTKILPKLPVSTHLYPMPNCNKSTKAWRKIQDRQAMVSIVTSSCTARMTLKEKCPCVKPELSLLVGRQSRRQNQNQIMRQMRDLTRRHIICRWLGVMMETTLNVFDCFLQSDS